MAFYDPDPDAPGKMSTRWGGFLDDVDKFDADFFGISPREAVTMDPQQRLLMTMAWEALENAGQSPQRLMGSSTGVFVGISSSDYLQMQMQRCRRRDRRLSRHRNCHSVASGRLSYFLGLQGPSIAVGYRVLLVAGRGAPCVSEPALRASATWRLPAESI